MRGLTVEERRVLIRCASSFHHQIGDNETMEIHDRLVRQGRAVCFERVNEEGNTVISYAATALGRLALTCCTLTT